MLSRRNTIYPQTSYTSTSRKVEWPKGVSLSDATDTLKALKLARMPGYTMREISPRRFSIVKEARNPLRPISISDEKFLRRAMRKFNIQKLRVRFDSSAKKWPDIWIEEIRGIPTITVTREWAKQNMSERRSRLLHETLHCLGLQHGKIGEYTFSTKPAEDTYSKYVYQQLVRNVNG